MIRLTLLGRLALVDPAGESLQRILSQPKRVAVLAYLALAGPGTFRRRDSLLALFWPDATEERARRSLNQTLHFLRQAFGGDTIVSRGPGELGICADRLWCDVVAYEQMIRAGDLPGALQLYRGELLPGFFTDAGPEFDQWLGSERARLQRSAWSAAWKLADASEARLDAAAAAEWARRAVDLSSNDEASARRLIDLLGRTGDRASALQAYDDFAARLAREYETEPSLETKRLLARIRAGAGEQLAAASPESGNVADVGRVDAAMVAPARGRHWFISITPFAIAAALLAIVGGAWASALHSWTPARSTGAGDPQASIMVRELETADPAPDSLHVGRALTAAVVHQLAQVRSFDVITVPARDSTTNSAAPPRILLTLGTLQSGTKVRVNVRVADAESGRTIRTAALDHPAGALLPLVDSLSLQIASLVRTAVGREMRLRAWRVGSGTERAFVLMQEAEEHRDRASSLSSSGNLSAAARALQSADSVLGEAERIAPRWPEPLIERAEVLQSLGAIFLIPPLRNLDWAASFLSRGVSVARLAVSLEPDDARAREVLGSVEYWYWLGAALPVDSARAARARAERDLRAAVTADPNRALALSLLSASLYARADYVGAYLTADQAYRADTYQQQSEPILDVLFAAAYEMDDGSAPIRWCDEIKRRVGPGWLSASCQLRLLAGRDGSDGRAVARAWRAVAEAREPGSHASAAPPQLQMLVAIILARAGLRDSAEAVARDARVRGGDDPELIPSAAELQLRLGRPDSAAALMVGYVTASPSRRVGVARSRTFADLVPLRRTLARLQTPAGTRK